MPLQGKGTQKADCLIVLVSLWVIFWSEALLLTFVEHLRAFPLFHHSGMFSSCVFFETLAYWILWYRSHVDSLLEGQGWVYDVCAHVQTLTVHMLTHCVHTNCNVCFYKIERTSTWCLDYDIHVSLPIHLSKESRRFEVVCELHRNSALVYSNASLNNLNYHHVAFTSCQLTTFYFVCVLVPATWISKPYETTKSYISIASVLTDSAGHYRFLFN